MPDLRGFADAHLPGRGGPRSVVELGSGLDSTAHLVDGEFVLRRRHDGEQTDEARLLAEVAARSPLPVPVPLAVDGPWMAYRLLPGRPLLEVLPLDAARTRDLARHLVDFVALVRTWDLAAPEDEPDLPALLAQAADDHAALGLRDPAVERFLRTPPPPPPDELVFAHNDLGAEHVLVDVDTTITGVVDWTDAARCDPAADLGLLHRDLGPAVLPLVPEPLRERALFRARCSVLEVRRYGVEHDRPLYARRAREAHRWLF